MLNLLIYGCKYWIFFLRNFLPPKDSDIPSKTASTINPCSSTPLIFSPFFISPLYADSDLRPEWQKGWGLKPDPPRQRPINNSHPSVRQDSQINILTPFELQETRITYYDGYIRSVLRKYTFFSVRFSVLSHLLCFFFSSGFLICSQKKRVFNFPC